MSTKQQRDEWQRLSDAATALPWVKSPSWKDPSPIAIIERAKDRGLIHVGLSHADCTAQDLADRDFIAAAREAIPALLLDVAALISERNGAVTVADRQRSRAKDAESELQRVKQERDALQRALLDAWSEWSETTITELPTESLAGVLRAVNERAEKAEADAAEMRSAIERACTDPGGLKGPDEWSHDIDMLRAARNGDAGRVILAEVARLREENAALKTTMEDEQAGRHTEVLHLVEQLAAAKVALGRAHAALTDIASANRLHGCSPDIAYQSASTESLIIAERLLLLDPEGKAAAKYVAALESEHEAVTTCTKAAGALDGFASSDRKLAHLIEDLEQAGKTLESAYAAVEALRGGR